MATIKLTSYNCLVGADVQPESSSTTTLYPKVCRNVDQFKAWQRSRHWLEMNPNTNGVQCSVCAEVKRLGIHNEPGQHNESEFVEGTVKMKDAKTLLKKIDKHRNSAMHVKCVTLLEIRSLLKQ